MKSTLLLIFAAGWVLLARCDPYEGRDLSGLDWLPDCSERAAAYDCEGQP